MYGFRVINRDCDVNDNILRVWEEPDCSHMVFIIPKDDRGERTVVDCSKLHRDSVIGYTQHVSAKFSYKCLDDVTECLEVGDFLCIFLKTHIGLCQSIWTTGASRAWPFP